MLRIVPHKGNAKTRQHVKRMAQRVRKGTQKAFLEMRKDLKPDAIADMKKPKHGREYMVYVSRTGRKLKRPRKHIASKRGESPAILTGRLSRSLGYRIKNGIVLTFGANTPYAMRHERMPLSKGSLPTAKGWRSYLMKTIDANRRNIMRSMERNIEDAVKAWKVK